MCVSWWATSAFTSRNLVAYVVARLQVMEMTLTIPKTPLTLVTTKVTYSILESERPERTRLPVDFNKDLREFLRIFCVMPTTKYGLRYYIGIYVATNILNK